jgi:hypothetical protein
MEKVMTTEEHINKLARMYDKTIHDNMILAFEEAVIAMGGDLDDFKELWAVSDSAQIATIYLKNSKG